MIPDLKSTIVALATPPGVGAIGVVRLSGHEALDIVNKIFAGKNLNEAESHTAHFGRIIDDEGQIIDEVLITIFRTPRSYTGENSAEISCHGSPYILQKVVELCTLNGARPAGPGEFTLRAFLNGKLELSQAEAVADLIASESEGAHQLAMRQLRTGFKHEMQRLRERLIHFASLIELELDFSEEDVEFANRDDLRALVREIQTYIQSLLDSFRLGNAIKTGVSTVIAGRPNAGKSTLLNALLRENRAIVSEIAGTTRDTIEETLNIRGVLFRIIDTAGIRQAQDEIESIGVEKTFEKIAQAALIVYVWDVAGGMSLADVYADLKALSGNASAPTLIVCNKMDRNPLFETAWLIDPQRPEVHPYLQPGADFVPPVRLKPEQIIPVSAKNEQNIGLLRDALFEAAIGAEGIPENHTVITNARHFDALRRAHADLDAVLTGLDRGVSGDFIAQDIRHSLAHLGEITGEIGTEDLLDKIFSSFCIGK